jgi:hypothetical protein
MKCECNNLGLSHKPCECTNSADYVVRRVDRGTKTNGLLSVCTDCVLTLDKIEVELDCHLDSPFRFAKIHHRDALPEAA